MAKTSPTIISNQVGISSPTDSNGYEGCYKVNKHSMYHGRNGIVIMVDILPSLVVRILTGHCLGSIMVFGGHVSILKQSTAHFVIVSGSSCHGRPLKMICEQMPR